MGSKGDAQRKAIVALATVFLALTYIMAGFAVVEGIPQVTEAIAQATVDDASSPFSKDQLVQGALATRDYSFSSHDLDAYQQAIAGMNEEAVTPYAGVSIEQLMSAPVQYTVDSEAVSHLDDVNGVFSRLMVPMFSVALIAVVLMMYALRYVGVDAVGSMLLYSGIVVLAAMLVLGCWALVSFDSFFAAFHSILFPDGGWTFPSDSLLITMLPEAFWSAMGAIWLGVSAFVALLSVVSGIVIRRRAARVK